MAERQRKWLGGDTEGMPAGYKEPPDTRALFQTIWNIDRNWMPFVRDEVAKIDGTKAVYRVNEFDDLIKFELLS